MGQSGRRERAGVGVLAAAVDALLQRPALRVLLHDVQTTFAQKRAHKADDVRVAVEEHEDLDLAKHLRGAGRREALVRDMFAAQQYAIILSYPHVQAAYYVPPEEPQI